MGMGADEWQMWMMMMVLVTLQIAMAIFKYEISYFFKFNQKQRIHKLNYQLKRIIY
jgi:hypothetical protein